MFTAFGLLLLVLSAFHLTEPAVAAAFTRSGQQDVGAPSRAPGAAEGLHARAARLASSPTLNATEDCMGHASTLQCDRLCPPASICSVGAFCSAALGVMIARSQLAGGTERETIETAVQGTPLSLRVAPESPPPRR